MTYFPRVKKFTTFDDCKYRRRPAREDISIGFILVLRVDIGDTPQTVFTGPFCIGSGSVGNKLGVSRLIGAASVHEHADIVDVAILADVASRLCSADNITVFVYICHFLGSDRYIVCNCAEVGNVGCTCGNIFPFSDLLAVDIKRLIVFDFMTCIGQNSVHPVIVQTGCCSEQARGARKGTTVDDLVRQGRTFDRHLIPAWVLAARSV